MEKVLEILKHIEELYAGDVSDEAIRAFADKNSEKVNAWREAFQDYDLADVFGAIDDFWNYKSNKTRPTVAQLRAKLNVGKVDKVRTDVQQIAQTDYAAVFMRRDIKLGCCRHLLPVYNQAVRYIAEDMLSGEMPVSQWKAMTFAERAEQAAKKGLFNRLDEVLVLVCRRRYGKDYQFDSANILKAHEKNSAFYSAAGNVRNLAAHYSAAQDSDFSDTIGF